MYDNPPTLAPMHNKIPQYKVNQKKVSTESSGGGGVNKEVWTPPQWVLSTQ